MESKQDAGAVVEAVAKFDTLEVWLQAAIEDVSGKRRKNQRRATMIKIATLGLSGGATILLGLAEQGAAASLVGFAFAFSAIVTVLNAVEPYFNFRALWIEHELAKSRFFALYDRVRFYREGKANEDLERAEADAFYAEYEGIWSDLNDAWMQKRRSFVEGAAARAKG